MESRLCAQVFADVRPELAAALLSAVGPGGDAASPCSAMLLPNHTLFSQPRGAAPALCVELKPKWGCLPTSAAIHPDNALKGRVSKFQLQQALKLAQVWLPGL